MHIKFQVNRISMGVLQRRLQKHNFEKTHLKFDNVQSNIKKI